MENAVLKKFREGRPSLGTFTAVGNPLAVESLRYTGLDYVIVDTEHTPAGIESATPLVTVAPEAPAVLRIRFSYRWTRIVWSAGSVA